MSASVDWSHIVYIQRRTLWSSDSIPPHTELYEEGREREEVRIMRGDRCIILTYD